MTRVTAMTATDSALITTLRAGLAERADAENKHFFIRKAIGWALREDPKANPHAVREYVAAHEAQLSPLSHREAMKRL